MGQVCKAANAWTNGPTDLVLSLHFNAAPESHKGRFHGTEALHWPGSRNGAMWARQLSAACAAELGTRDRGPKAQSASSSGKPLLILRDTLAPAVILESHFGDHAEDHSKAMRARRSGRLAEALAAIFPPSS